MNLKHSWIIAEKDLKTIRRRKTVLYTIVLLPILLALLFPAVVQIVFSKAPDVKVSHLTGLLDTCAFWFVVLAAILPSPIASYSIVGEKTEKSLEPLLATPVSDGEKLLGKSIAAFLPTIVATWASSALYMGLIDWETYGKLGHLLYPNWEMVVILLVLVPVTALLSIESNVIVSSRVTDVRSASQLGGVLFVPFMGIYLAGEIGVITLDTGTLLIISAIYGALVVALFFVSTRTFQREQIHTKWK